MFFFFYLQCLIINHESLLIHIATLFLCSFDIVLDFGSNDVIYYNVLFLSTHRLRLELESLKQEDLQQQNLLQILRQLKK